MIKYFEETEMSQGIYIMLLNSIAVMDLKVSIVCCNIIKSFILVMIFYLNDKHPYLLITTFPVFAQKEETIRACIAGNV